jgi:hypothetical protein
MLTKDEQVRIVRDIIKRAERAIEDGWDDDDPGYIFFEARKLFALLYNNLGWVKDGDLEDLIFGLKGRYANSRRALDDMKLYMSQVSKALIDKISTQDRCEHGQNNI